MKQSVPVIRRVRFKDGRAPIEVIRNPRDGFIRAVKGRLAEALDGQAGDVAGMAVVVWGTDGASTASMIVSEWSPVVSAMAPDFMRNRLLLYLAETWTRGGLRDDGVL